MQLKHLLPAALAAVAVHAQDDSEGSQNLTALLSSNDNLSGLATLLESAPDVAELLANASDITLLAPSNDALQALNESGALETASQQEGFLQALLQYHVLVGNFSAENFTSTPLFPATLLNDTEYANVTGGQVVEVRTDGDDVLVISGLKNNVTVEEADLAFDGGIVHIIDGLLTIPPNVSDVASAANLTAFLGAVNATDLTEAVTDTPDLTIFAPNNAAFASIANILANVSTEDAADLLQYHVINGTVAYSSTLANGTVPTLGGDNITITILDGEVFVNRARVVTADILLSNGVLHVIDSVLNPDAAEAEDGSSEGVATAFPSASSGSEIPFTSGLPSATTSVPALTSTNEAVASGFPTPSESAEIGQNTAGNPEASGTESSEDAASMPTGAVGVAALFGGAALLANL